MRGNKFTEHRHKCKNKQCGVIWQHNPNDCTTDHQFAQSHLCPSCGTDQRQIFYGAATAVCRHDGFTTSWGDIPLPPEVPSGTGRFCKDDPEFDKMLETKSDDEVATFMAEQYRTMTPPAQRLAMSLMLPYKDQPGHPAALVLAKLAEKKPLDKSSTESVGLWV